MDNWIANQGITGESDLQSRVDQTNRPNLVDFYIKKIGQAVHSAWDNGSLLSQVARGNTYFNTLVANRLVNNSGEAGTGDFAQEQWSNLARQEVTVALACRIMADFISIT